MKYIYLSFCFVMTSIFSFSDDVNTDSHYESDVNQNSSINQEDGLYAEIKTSKGDILILLEYETNLILSLSKFLDPSILISFPSVNSYALPLP